MADVPSGDLPRADGSDGSAPTDGSDAAPVANGSDGSAATADAELPDSPSPDTSDGADADAVLPVPARLRVVELASAALDGLTGGEVPATLRPFAKFTRTRRARAAAGQLAAALATDPVFRQKVAEHARTVLPDLVGAVAAGHPPAAAPPAEVAALAYLIQPSGWAGMVTRAGDDLVAAEVAAVDREREGIVAALRAQVEAVRAAGRDEADRLRAELALVRREVDDLRRRLKEAMDRVSAAGRAVADAQRSAEQATGDAAAAVSASEVESRRLRARLDAAEAAAGNARRSAREGREASDRRLRLLLDVLLGAARGLQTELALPPAVDRPADEVAAGLTRVAAGLTREGGAPAARGLADDDPAVLDHLLALPLVHVVVDGYNVTKLGYGSLTLEAQRHRLVTGMAAVAGQTGAEVTVVFDGAERVGPLAAPQPRGVRVLFSPADVTADEVIRQLVRAEPGGRPVVVVSNDREVVDAVRRWGARPVSSAALLRRLDRT